MPPGPWERVVALAPDVTELAFAVAAGELLVAVSPHADYPAGARLLPRVNPNNVEEILAQRPDLVLATTAGNDPRVVDQLRRVKVPVCTVDVTSCDRLAEAGELLGTILGKVAEGSRLAAQIRDRCSAVARAAADLPRLGALYVVWWEPLIAAAPGTFHDDALRLAGLDNLTPGRAGRYPLLDREILLDPRLHVVVTSDEPDVRATYRATEDRPYAARLRSGAVRVIWLPADAISRPGPRLPSAIEALLRARESPP